jgi:hypothetical protein
VTRFLEDETESAAGPSLLEMLEEDLDEALNSLMALKARNSAHYDPEESRLTGVCYGLARAVGTIRSPYDPDAGLQAARGAAMLRYKRDNSPEQPGG